MAGIPCLFPNWHNTTANWDHNDICNRSLRKDPKVLDIDQTLFSPNIRFLASSNLFCLANIEASRASIIDSKKDVNHFIPISRRCRFSCSRLKPALLCASAHLL
jgi:hypothetical protein